MSNVVDLTDQQRNLLEVIVAAGEKGRVVGSFDHRPAGQLVSLGLIEPVGERRFRARAAGVAQAATGPAVDAPQPAGAPSRAERVLAMLAQQGPMAAHWIAAALGVPIMKANNTLSSLSRAGKIVRQGSVRRPPGGTLGGPKKTGLWALPDGGAGAALPGGR